MQSILNISVSCFRDVEGKTAKDVNLLMWLTSDKYREKVELIRSISDEPTQKIYKKTLPCCTPGGRFSGRTGKTLLEHSGFLPFDVDFQDNTHITNFDELKEQISHIQNVAYCGLSVRGKGFWGLVPIPKSTLNEHKLRFEALRQDFAKMGITLDPAGDEVNRLRVYSYDENPYFSHEAKVYTKIFKPVQKPVPTYTRPASGDNTYKVESLIKNLSGIDITQHPKHEWFKIGCALYSEFGEAGRSYFHEISKYHERYDPDETDKKYNDCAGGEYSKITISSLFDIAKQYGILYKEAKPETVKLLTKEELKDLALKYIGEFNHIPGDELRNKIGKDKTNQLISNLLITEIESIKDHYYLTGNYPF